MQSDYEATSQQSGSKGLQYSLETGSQLLLSHRSGYIQYGNGVVMVLQAHRDFNLKICCLPFDSLVRCLVPLFDLVRLAHDPLKLHQVKNVFVRTAFAHLSSQMARPFSQECNARCSFQTCCRIAITLQHLGKPHFTVSTTPSEAHNC